MPTQPTSPSHREFDWNGFGDVAKDMLGLAKQLDTPKDLSLLKKSDLCCPSSSTEHLQFVSKVRILFINCNDDILSTYNNSHINFILLPHRLNYII